MDHDLSRTTRSHSIAGEAVGVRQHGPRPGGTRADVDGANDGANGLGFVRSTGNASK